VATDATQPVRRVWWWVFGGFLFQAIPAAVRDEALPVALKNLGQADGEITRWVAWLGLLVGIKILWAPLVGFTAHPPRLILGCQLAVVALLAALQWSVGAAVGPAAFLALAAISIASACHDFVLDGYYVASLDDRPRAAYSGLLTFASKCGQVLAGPGLIWLAGFLHHAPDTPWTAAWQQALGAALGLAGLCLVINAFAFRREPPLRLPPRADLRAVLAELFRAPRFLALLGLIVFYRASEIHLTRVLPLFAMAAPGAGGLGFDNEAFAGLRLLTAVGGLALGGLVGSQVVAARGVGRSLLPLGLVMHLPLLGILWLAYHPDASRLTVGALFFAEYVAYGAGVCALLLAMMELAAGPHAAIRYAMLSTLGLAANYLPGLWAGTLAERLGYAGYFAFALSLAIPGVLATWVAQRRFTARP
jgi:hypothetical protein